MLFSPLKTKLSIVSLFAFFFSFANISPTFSQANNYPFNCGADEYWEEKAKQNPVMATQRLQFLEKMVKLESARSKDENDEVRIIPVVFHVLHSYGPENISKQRILDQLNTLNETFAGSNSDTQLVRGEYKHLIAKNKVVFRLATKDPNGNCTDGIIRVFTSETEEARDNIKSISYWNSNNYLNIWVVSSINNFGQAGTVLGYAQFPWDNNANTDGIVMRADQVKANNKTLTHELGHYLGLLHTFQGSCGNSCQNSGDFICDTPPSSGPTQGCPGTTYNSCSNDVPNLPDMTENFMDYSSCARMFTLGQQERMKQMFSNTKRANLVTAENLERTGVAENTTSLCIPVADFYATQYTICEGGNINFKDNSFNGAPSEYEWSFQGGIPAVSTDKDPVVTFAKAGTYEVELEAKNASGSSRAVRTALITVLPAIADEKAPHIQDFEDFTQNNGYVLTGDSKGLNWAISGNAASEGSRSLYLNNYNGEENEFYNITLPPVDMTTTSTTSLTFDLAYAQRNSLSFDELRIQVSSNCGESFNSIFYKSGPKLTTISGFNSTFFTPLETEWRKEEISLNSFKNTKNLIIRISFKSRKGNNIFIDNLNVGEAQATSIAGSKHFPAKANMQIYPNPASNNFILRTNSTERNAALEVFDASGKQLIRLQGLQINENEPLQLNKNMLNINANGVYYIKLHTVNASFVQKLIISE